MGSSVSKEVAPSNSAGESIELDKPSAIKLSNKLSEPRKLDSLDHLVDLKATPNSFKREEVEKIEAQVPAVVTASPEIKVIEVTEVVEADMEQNEYYQDTYQVQLPSSGSSRVNSLRGIQQLAAAPERRKDSHPEDKYAPTLQTSASASTSPFRTERKKSSPTGTPGNLTPVYGLEDDITEGHTDVDDVELQPLDILLQFIPYYGQGDPANDAIVRSTLSGMSVEDIDSKDEFGNTLLLLACQYRCEDLARIMLNKGANPSALNSAGACCLHFACYKESQSMSIAKVLLQSGASPEVVESTYGCTPLHYCAGSGNIDLCKMLLSHGAQVNSADFYNYTCVDYAREARMMEAATYLQQRLDQLNMQNSYRMMGTFGGMGMNMGMGGYNGNQNGGYYGIQQQQQQQLQQQQQFQSFIFSDWREEMDPASGERYYINYRTGDSLWEQDFKLKVAANATNNMGPGSGNMGPGSNNMGGNQNHMGPGSNGNGNHNNSGPGSGMGGMNHNMNNHMGNMNNMNSNMNGHNSGMGMMSGPGSGPGSPSLDMSIGPYGAGTGMDKGGGMGGAGPGGNSKMIRKASLLTANPYVLPEKALETEAYKLRVFALLSKYSTKKLPDIDNLMSQYQGRENELMSVLCKQYDIPYDIEMSAYKLALKELQQEYTQRKSFKSNTNGNSNSLSINSNTNYSTGFSNSTGISGNSSGNAPRVPPSPSVGGNGNSMSNVLAAVTGGGVGGAGTVDQVAVQQMIAEARAQHEVQMVTMLNDNR